MWCNSMLITAFIRSFFFFILKNVPVFTGEYLFSFYRLFLGAYWAAIHVVGCLYAAQFFSFPCDWGGERFSRHFYCLPDTGKKCLDASWWEVSVAFVLWHWQELSSCHWQYMTKDSQTFDEVLWAGLPSFLGSWLCCTLFTFIWCVLRVCVSIISFSSVKIQRFVYKLQKINIPRKKLNIFLLNKVLEEMCICYSLRIILMFILRLCGIFVGCLYWYLKRNSCALLSNWYFCVGK